jgi:UDP-sugar transporter A1/2/3
LFVFSSNSLLHLVSEISKNRKVLLKYIIPSFLYSLYNNLAFVNLSSYDPTTYFLLLQFRVVVTGVIYEMLFSKKLTRQQWFSLILLTLGCLMKQLNTHIAPSSAAASSLSYFNYSLLFILVQIFSSCFAGVYNEFILKESSLDIMLQNIFMYMDSIVCNLALLFVFQSSSSSSLTINAAFSLDSLYSLLDLKVILIMVNNAAVGIVTSLFLKSLNSILKTFASALELMFTAILAWIIFSIPLDLTTFVAILIVSAATWLYSLNPVNSGSSVTNSITSSGASEKDQNALNSV